MSTSESRILCSSPVEQFKSQKEAIQSAILSALSEGHYILGAQVREFEREFASYHGLAHSVGVGSGTDALVLALRALGIGPGDEVITVAHTALATVAAVCSAGATPVLVDVDPDTYTLAPENLRAALSPKTRAIIPVHLYGQPCAMDEILSFAREHGLKVVEDCAQAHGATYKNRKVGTMGEIGCFSFYPTKNLGAMGDGGGIVTASSECAEVIREMRQYGWNSDRVSVRPGVVSRLDEIHAAVLRVKLKTLDESNRKRNRLARRYDSLMDRLGLPAPLARPGAVHAYHLYVTRVSDREKLRASLSKDGIDAGIHYAVPAHLHPGYRDRIRLIPGGLPVTERLAKEVLSLPIYPELTDDEQGRVERALEAGIGDRKHR